MHIASRSHTRPGVLLVIMALFSVASAQRLPSNAIPTHYTLALTPDIPHASFTGSETIDLTLAAPASSITLNALDLKLTSSSANDQPSTTVTYDPTREQATLSFAHTLPAGPVALRIAFGGTLNSKLRGFYLSRSKSRSYAVTQFEATDARRAFPSFDEPALKSTFDIALTVDSADTAISNTDIFSDQPASPGKHTLTFRTTPRMSTYLVAFLVGDFSCSRGKSEGVPIRVCSTPDKVNLTKFALEAAEHFLKYYDTYFGIPYPMPKLDLIGIPDFEAGAMENFGAITYRETELLVDPREKQTGGRKRVATVVAHEMAHQWFGDMVTMQWWDNLWLNEGFSTWMESKAVNDWHPEWNLPLDIAEDLNNTLDYDSVRSTRSIRTRTDTPAEIAEAFDGIAYGKAGAVLGMVEQWLSPEVFRAGVQAYLRAHLYANATAEDFWNAETSTSHLPVDQVMRSFIDLPGVPLLTFATQQATGTPIRQTRFFLDGPPAFQPELWTVPVCLKPGPCALVSPLTSTVPVGFLYANAGARGYYRVAYTGAQAASITAALPTLTPAERITFLGDRWALTRAGAIPVGDFLNLALALQSDPTPQVGETILSTLAQIRTEIAAPADRQPYDAILRTRLAPLYASAKSRQQRAELFAALGQAGDPSVLQRARILTDDLFERRKVSEPDLIDASVELAAANGTEDFYDRMLLVSENAADPGLQAEALQMLTRFRQPLLVVRTLTYAASDAVRTQDAWILFAQELQQPETRELAWAWIRGNWPRVQARLTTSSGSNLVAATGSFCTEAQHEEVASFFAEHKVEASERTLSKALDSISACIALRTKQEPNLRAWLQRSTSGPQ